MQRIIRVINWMLVDFAIVFVAHLVALTARVLSFPEDYGGDLSFIFFSAIFMVIVLHFHNAYRIYWRRASGHNIVILVRSVAWGTGILFLIDLSINPRMLPLSVLVIGMLLALGGLIVVRYRSRLIGAFSWRWRAIWRQEFPEEKEKTERVLIIGAGESGQTTAVRLKHHFDDAHYTVVGFVDDDPNKQGMYLEGAPILGKTTDIGEIAQREKVDLIAVAVHNIEGERFRKILQSCEDSTARVKIVPDILKMFNTKFSRNFLRDVQPEDIIGRNVVTRHEGVDLGLISNRVVLVTGAAGSIGSEIARQIAQYHSPTKLIILDNNESGLYDLQQELLAKHKDFPIITALADITQYAMIKNAFSKYQPSLVFHAAAYKHVPMLEDYPNEAVRVNIGGTMNVAKVAMSANVERFVLISSDKAVDPSSVMGASKRICELMIHALSKQENHRTIFTAVRFGNVLGSRGSVVPLFNRQIDQGGPVTVTDKEMTRYFMSISEAVNLVIHAAALTVGNDVFVLKMGEVIKIDDLAQRMIRLRGLRPFIDIPIIYTGIRPGEKLHESLNDSFESLTDTIHPSIMKFNDDSWDINANEFVHRAYKLVQTGIPEGNHPLEYLRTLCGFQYAFSQTGD